LKTLIAVNNAGTINKNNKIWEVSAEEFDMVMDTNIKGVANVLRHFLPLMIERKQGVIVNMSSGWGRSAAAEVINSPCINASRPWFKISVSVYLTINNVNCQY